MEERVNFASAGLRLAGILHRPDDLKAGARRAAFLLLHGFGSNKDSSSMIAVARALTGLGYVALRFDMRGCGDSEGARGRVICLEQVEDTKSALSWIASRSEVDAKRIGVLGHSFGAAVAVYTAGVEPRLAACVSSGGWGDGETKFRKQHESPEAWKRFSEMLQRGREKLKRGESMMVPRFDIVPIRPELRVGLAPGSVLEFPFEVVESMYTFKANDVVGRIAPRPLLLIHPSNDSVTPTEQSIEMFRRAGMPAELHLVTGVDHFLWSENNLRVLNLLRDWLSGNLPGAMSPQRLERLVGEIFAGAGMSAEHAGQVAAVLVWADLRGMGTHGVMRVPRYVELIRAGDLNPRPAMTTRNETAACVLLEADRAAGPIAMQEGTKLALQKARQAGAGVCLVRATTHTAALGYYTHMAADAGMAAIAFSGSWPNMAYHGARAAGVSTAPLALAVPGDGAPIALDMASGIVSMGKLMQARRTGQSLEPGLALDENGNATTDARAAAVPPLGGAKGSGLSLLIECLASLVTGNPLLAEALEGTPLGARHRQNGGIIAIDIARFVDPADFRREAARLGRAIKALPPQPGAEILLPGERGDRAAAAQRDEVTISASVLEELKALAVSFGIQA